MTTSVPDILAPLADHCDRIIRRPMTNEDIDDLERQVGLPVPPPFRDFLRIVGLFQDLTAWGVSSIELYDHPSQFADARRFLSDLLPPKEQDLFPFGGDGAGNVFCLPAAAVPPLRIHFVDHETGKVSEHKDFEVWLKAVVAKVVRGIRRRTPNEYKVRSVQFSFQRTSYDELTALLGASGPFQEVDSDWTNSSTSSAGVTSSDRRIEVGGETVQIQRLEYPSWDAPLLSFDLQEPLAKEPEHSRIRMLDRLFARRCAGYRLVDYGPVDSRELG